jgi:hypothetical protein
VFVVECAQHRSRRLPGGDNTERSVWWERVRVAGHRARRQLTRITRTNRRRDERVQVRAQPRDGWGSIARVRRRFQ